MVWPIIACENTSPRLCARINRLVDRGSGIFFEIFNESHADADIRARCCVTNSSNAFRRDKVLLSQVKMNTRVNQPGFCECKSPLIKVEAVDIKGKICRSLGENGFFNTHRPATEIEN